MSLGNWQIETMMKYHYIPIITVKNKQTNRNTPTHQPLREDAEQQKLSLTAGRNAKWYSQFGRHLAVFLQR